MGDTLGARPRFLPFGLKVKPSATINRFRLPLFLTLTGFLQRLSAMISWGLTLAVVPYVAFFTLFSVFSWVWSSCGVAALRTKS